MEAGPTEDHVSYFIHVSVFTGVVWWGFWVPHTLSSVFIINSRCIHLHPVSGGFLGGAPSQFYPYAKAWKGL